MSKLSKIANKAADGMLIDAFTDNIMKKPDIKMKSCSHYIIQ